MSKNKLTIALLLSPLSLGLISCQGGSSSTSLPSSENSSSFVSSTENSSEGSSSSESSSVSSSSPSSSSNPSSSSSSVEESVQPDIVFDSITDVFNYLSNDGTDKEKEHAVSYEKNSHSYETSVFSYVETDIHETGTSYSDRAFAAEGQETVKRIYDYKDPETTKDSYKVLRQDLDGTFYDVIDYDSGMERDSATREKITAAQAQERTALTSVDSLLALYQRHLKSQIIAGADAIEPTIDKKTGESIYEIEKSYRDTIEGFTYSYIISCDLTFSKDMALTHFVFDFQEYSDDVDEMGNPTGTSSLFAQVKEEQTIVYGEKSPYDGKGLSPLDYFMTDFAIQLQYSDGIMPTYNDVDASAFPYDSYVHVRAIDVQPSKALDTTLSITASSDPKVISVTTYEDGTYMAKAIGEGETTLTVKAENGMEKTIDVTVKAPQLSSIRVESYSPFHYKGDTEDIYIYLEPENTLEEIEVISETPDLLEVLQDENGYYSVRFKEVGDGVLTVRSKTRPEEMKTSVTFHIQEKLSEEEVQKSVIGTWTGSLPDMNNVTTIENAVEFTFEEGGKGTFTLKSDDTGYTFPTGQKFDFTYEFTPSTYPDRIRMDMSSITYVSDNGFKTTYDSNGGYFYMTGKDAMVTLSISDPNYYSWTLNVDLVKIS